MVVPCSRLISQPFLTSWAGRRDDDGVLRRSGMGARHHEETNVSSLTKWLSCVLIKSISQPALMSDKHRWQLVGLTAALRREAPQGVSKVVVSYEIHVHITASFVDFFGAYQSSRRPVPTSRFYCVYLLFLILLCTCVID